MPIEETHKLALKKLQNEWNIIYNDMTLEKGKFHKLIYKWYSYRQTMALQIKS